jgi:hypothetical protein
MSPPDPGQPRRRDAQGEAHQQGGTEAAPRPARATGGRTVPATWREGSVVEPVALTGADGGPVRLAPGTTWVELVPTSTGSVTVG